MWSLFFLYPDEVKGSLCVFYLKKNCELKLKMLLNKYKKLCYTNQSSAAQKNHEYDKGFKPGVLNNLVAGFSQIPPCFSSKLFVTNHRATDVSNTTWKWETIMNVWKECTCTCRVARAISEGREKSTATLTASLLMVFRVLPWEKNRKHLIVIAL